MWILADLCIFDCFSYWSKRYSIQRKQIWSLAYRNPLLDICLFAYTWRVCPYSPYWAEWLVIIGCSMLHRWRYCPSPTYCYCYSAISIPTVMDIAPSVGRQSLVRRLAGCVQCVKVRLAVSERLCFTLSQTVVRTQQIWLPLKGFGSQL